MGTETPNVLENVGVRSALLHALESKLRAAGGLPPHIDENSQLLQLGLIDSTALVEVIIEVERQCGCEFNPEEIDLETGLTIASLAASFAPLRLTR